MVKLRHVAISFHYEEECCEMLHHNAGIALLSKRDVREVDDKSQRVTCVMRNQNTTKKLSVQSVARYSISAASEPEIRTSSLLASLCAVT